MTQYTKETLLVDMGYTMGMGYTKTMGSMGMGPTI